MPELPEVERAAALIRSVAAGRRITRVETVEDTIVFSGITHREFSTELTNRTVKNAGRFGGGKVFYIELDGKGKMPVLHFGMTGMLQVKGELPTYCRVKPRKAPQDWPPRFMKFILHLSDDNSDSVTQLAFMDARRLGRIRLCADPLREPPISALGFDPILSMPCLENFQEMVLKRTCPIKALLLDQSFSAGVGNWIADEVLYHSRVHPEQRCNTLTEGQVSQLHRHIGYVCETAVEANADDTKFPDNWLFKHRWGKGKKQHTLKLPSGELATIKWLTVGGRTSAYVEELQILPSKRKQATHASQDSESELTPLTDSEAEGTSKLASKKRKAVKQTLVKEEVISESADKPMSSKTKNRSKRQRRET